MQTAKKHDQHGFSQFRLTNKTVNNLSQFDLTPTAKLVLVYLTTCYNPKKADMFPKQKTIAMKLGISERSIVRAISELIKAGLIVVECKYSNRYKFTSKIVSKSPEIEKNFEAENMSDDLSQNDIKKDDKKSSHDIEPMREHNKEPLKVEDYKILKAYAQKMGAKNLNAYINKLISSGSAKDIIKEAKQIEANAKAMVNFTQENTKKLEFARANAWNPSEEWIQQQRKKLEKNCLIGNNKGKNVY